MHKNSIDSIPNLPRLALLDSAPIRHVYTPDTPVLERGGRIPNEVVSGFDKNVHGRNFDHIVCSDGEAKSGRMVFGKLGNCRVFAISLS